MFRDPARGIYKRLVIEDDRLIGAVMYGDTADGNWFFGLIKDQTDIEEMRDTLIYGPAFQGGGAAGADPLAAVAALPPEAEICGCNGVCKGQIVDAIGAGADTLDALRAQTKASASCGTCTGLVEQLLAVTLGDSFDAGGAKPVCGCTDLTHEDVRRLIKARELRTQPAVWQELAWKTVNGCPTCRPAINFYLLAEWPLDYQDDAQSRFVNERNHANIQKDGTYSVVPRAWGGMTTAAESTPAATASTIMVPISEARLDVRGGVWAIRRTLSVRSSQGIRPRIRADPEDRRRRGGVPAPVRPPGTAQDHSPFEPCEVGHCGVCRRISRILSVLFVRETLSASGPALGRLITMGWNENWAGQAACRGKSDALFVKGAEQNRAKQVCGSCNVRAECLAEALDNRIEWGVWGGMTERERRALLRRRPNVAAWRSVLQTA